jgi:transglutaminase-like putative cysteine protease
MATAVLAASAKLLRRAGWPNLAAVLLVCLEVISLVIGLNASIAGLEVWSLLTFGLAAVLFGWLLAGTRLSGWAAAGLTLVIGAGLSLLLTGRLIFPAGRLLLAEAEWLAQAARLKRLSLESLGALDDARLLQAWQGLISSWQNFAARIEGWAEAIAAGRPANDPLVVLMIWVLLTWLVAAWAGWWVRSPAKSREHALIGLLPTGILLAGFVAYTASPIYPIALWLGALIALQVLGSYLDKTNSWRARNIDKAEIELEWTLAALVILACLLTFSLATPAFTVSFIADPVRQAFTPRQEPSVAGALGLANSPPAATTVLENGQNPGLPNGRLLGAGPELSEKIVMWISLEAAPGNPDALASQETAPPATESTGSQAIAGQPGYSWRGLTYDRYTGRGWSTTPQSYENFAAGQAIPTQLLPVSDSEIQWVRQLVEPASSGQAGKGATPPSRLLYAAGELVSASAPYQVSWRGAGDIFGASIAARSYVADSRLLRPTFEQLRAAGDDYPEDIRRAYLQLPQSLPRRVWDLALDLTAAQPTAYDQAAAIESYLRRLPYTLDIPPPPPDRDVVYYFLFDLRQGYCDYYASALVVLARAAGLPARLVTGFASGGYNSTENRYTITEADAHSWAEVYFPGYGWVEFEPTASRPAISRPNGYPESRDAELVGLTTPPIQPSRPDLRWGLAVLAGLLLLIPVGLAADWLRLGWLPAGQTISILYRRLYRQARRLDAALPVNATPLELADQLGGRLQAANPGEQPIPGRIQAHLHNLAWRYAESTYSAHAPGIDEKHSSLTSWRAIQAELWRARLRQALRKPSEPGIRKKGNP